MSNEIPEITEPMGKHWKQPAVSEILIDDTHAIMTLETMSKLAEYSCSVPSGVYPGKMWRSDDYAYHKAAVDAGHHRHWLKWFGISDDPKMCSNNSRKILLV